MKVSGDVSQNKTNLLSRHWAGSHASPRPSSDASRNYLPKCLTRNTRTRMCCFYFVLSLV